MWLAGFNENDPLIFFPGSSSHGFPRIWPFNRLTVKWKTILSFYILFIYNKTKTKKPRTFSVNSPQFLISLKSHLHIPQQPHMCKCLINGTNDNPFCVYVFFFPDLVKQTQIPPPLFYKVIYFGGFWFVCWGWFGLKVINKV